MASWSGAILNSVFVRIADYYKRRFDRQTQNASEVNERTLRQILHLNRKTEIGQRYRFADIDSVAAYRKTLPLSTHEDYRADIERMARGERNVLTADRVSGFGLTSGTTGAGKMVPITATQRRKTALAMMFLTQGCLAAALPAARRGGRGLLLMGATAQSQTTAGLPVGPGTALGMRAMLRMSPLLWTSPPEAYEILQQSDALYVHLLFAILSGDARYLSAPFASAILDLLRTLELRAGELVYDVDHGTLRGVPDLDPQLRERLQRRLRPQPDLARWLSEQLASGMDGIATRIFPDLTHINTVTTGGFAVYSERLQRYLGDLPIYSSIYAATEAVLGIGLGLAPGRYALVPGMAHFEFIPEAQLDEAQPTTCGLEELSVGHRYEIVLSTWSGLYRYRLGDIIEVSGQYHKTPLVEFMHRRGALLNICGEKTTERAAYTALLRSIGVSGVQLADYTTRVDIDSLPQRYVFYIELGATDRSIDAPSLAAQLADSLDSTLGQANPMYALSRQPQRIGPAEIRLVRPQTFQRLREVFIARGASPTQAKVPRVLGDPEMLAILERNQQ